jgi:hypothetical protein
MNVCISEHPVRLELSVFKGGGTAIVHSNAHEAYSFLKAHANRPFAAGAMRTLLSGGGAPSPGSDDEVWREAARQLAAGRLHLSVSERSEANGVAVADSSLSGSPASAPPKRSPVSAERPLPPPRKRAPVEEAPAPEPEQTASLDQDVQAAMLERAATGGRPLCAVCEKARMLAGEPA